MLPLCLLLLLLFYYYVLIIIIFFIIIFYFIIFIDRSSKEKRGSLPSSQLRSKRRRSRSLEERVGMSLLQGAEF